MNFESLPPGWEQWHTEPTKAVLAYRPDVFDTDEFPAPCLPTIYLTKGKRSRRPGRDPPDPDDLWYVTLYLEPEITDERTHHEDREAARESATDLAAAFARGEVDYRSLYQVPREAYFERLDELTGE